MRCGDLVASLAREAKAEVEVPKILAEHRIFLDRRGVSPLVALRCVARTTGASLFPTSKGYRLERTDADLRAIREHRMRLRVRWFEERLASVVAFRRANLASAKREDAFLKALRRDVATFEAIGKGLSPSFPANDAATLLPSQILLEGLVRRLGVATLAAIPSDRTVVFEDAPVPGARHLPPHEDLTRTYLADTRTLLAGPLVQSIQEDEELAPSAFRFARIPDETRGTSRLRLRCYANENAVWMTLEAFDSAGKQVDRAFLMASPSGTRLPSSAFMWKANRNAEARWLDLSPAARTALEVTNAPLATLPAWFLDPVENEPLDLFVNEAVAGFLADERGACVAMDVPDDLWVDVKGCVVKGRLSLDALRADLAEWSPYERVADADGVAWRLIDPESAEAHRADRAVLRRFARAVVPGRTPEFRATCHLFHDASREEAQLPDTWVAVARRTVTPTPVGALPSRTYALLGAIPDAAWADLMAGSVLSAEQLGIAADLRRFFEPEPGPLVMGDGTRSVSDLDRYPLELFSDGNVGTSSFAVTSGPEPVIRIWSPTKPEPDYWTSPDALAGSFRLPPFLFRFQGGQWVCRISREKYEQGLDGLAFRRGSRQATRFRIGLPKGVSIPIELPGTVIPEPAALRYHDLPQEVRDANWTKAIRDGVAEAQAHPERAGTPPPNAPQ